MIKKNNIKFIDLGLPNKILWGDRNFGNNKYYQWGDLIGYSKYQVGKEKIFYWKHYIFYKNDKITKYNDSDKLLELQPEDDIVTQTLGNNYRIPRKEDFEELLKNTYKKYNKNSVIFKSKINGNQIIFPLLGYAYESSIYGSGLYCYFWSSSFYENDLFYAWELHVDTNVINAYNNDSSCSIVYYKPRCLGYIIRPIYDKEK